MKTARPQRRLIRLRKYDYSQAGMYFITICCHGRAQRFGKVKHNKTILNEFGVIARDQWVKLSERYQNVQLDVFQIMPNHMHGIIVLKNPTKPVGAPLAGAPTDPQNPNTVFRNANPNENRVNQAMIDNQYVSVENTNDYGNNNGDERVGADGIKRVGASPTHTKTVSDIIGSYKSLVAMECLKIFKTNNETMGKLWQRNFYEHIIRNERAYRNIAHYITNNPLNWNLDKLNK